MFEKLVESSSARKRGKRWPYFTATATVWMMALTMIIATGIFAYDARLNDQYTLTALATPTPPPAPLRRVSEHRPSASDKTQPVERIQSVLTVPDKISAPRQTPPDFPQIETISVGVNRNGADTGSPFGSAKGIPEGIDTGSPYGDKSAAPPPPKPPEAKRQMPPVEVQIVRRASQMLQGTAIRKVEPSYPALAKAACVSGAVVVEVLIDEQGNVSSARVLSGHPLLKDVSLAAALKWRWNPTMLNGVGVKVIGTITFNFML